MAKINVMQVNEEIPQNERLTRLNKIAIHQMKLLTDDSSIKKLEGGK